MSLTVPADLLEKARNGPITDEEFLSCIKESLPYAWSVVSGLVERVQTGDSCTWAEDGTAPPSDEAHAQLLRLVGSDAMRGAIERRYGVRLAFQNCCKVGIFTATATAQYEEFISPRAQVLNQRPALINC